jgi:hypothetical protein
LEDETFVASYQAEGKMIVYFFCKKVQGCQIILGTIPKWGKYNHQIYQMATTYTKWPPHIPNGHHIYQMAQNIPNGQTIYQMGKKYTKWAKNIPNGQKIYQMGKKYTNIFHCKTLQNLPIQIKIGIYGLKICHLATLIKLPLNTSSHKNMLKIAQQ